VLPSLASVKSTASTASVALLSKETAGGAESGGEEDVIVFDEK